MSSDACFTTRQPPPAPAAKFNIISTLLSPSWRMYYEDVLTDRKQYEPPADKAYSPCPHTLVALPNRLIKL